MTSKSKRLFLESLSRCKKREDFIDRFYERFLSASEEVAWLFRNTSFRVQRIKLLKSLEMIVLAIEGIPEAVQHLNERAVSHSRDHLDIKPELYDYWLESLLQTVVECDQEYNNEIEIAWREVTGFIIKHMIARY